MKEINNTNWVFNKKKLSLITKSKKYDQNFSYVENDSFFFLWDPFSSKFGAAIFNGLEILPITSNSKILYITEFPNKSLIHFSNLLNENGKILVFIDTNSNTNKKFIRKIPYNVKLIDEFDQITTDNEKNSFDVIIIDTKFLTKEKFNQIDKCLKNNGFLFLVEETNLILKQMNVLEENYFSKYSILQKINLADFFKNQTMIVSQKTTI